MILDLGVDIFWRLCGEVGYEEYLIFLFDFISKVMLKFNSRFFKDKLVFFGFKICVEVLKGMIVVWLIYLNFLEVVDECVVVKILELLINVNKDDIMLYCFYSEMNVICLNVYIVLI